MVCIVYVDGVLLNDVQIWAPVTSELTPGAPGTCPHQRAKPASSTLFFHTPASHLSLDFCRHSVENVLASVLCEVHD